MNSPSTTQSEIVAAQYEAWIYPAPIPDLEAAVTNDGYWDLSDPSLFRRKLWPRNVEPNDLNILIAGCGTVQAAYYAYKNPNSKVVGIDLSKTSLGHQAYLKQKHDLHNLQLFHMSLGDVSSLGQDFDFIVSTGVLHHLPDPDAGLRCLRDVLRPHGVISCMLYGYYPRFGVYMLQDLFRTLGAKQDPTGVDIVKKGIASLPAWHFALNYIRTASDLSYDSGLVDTFLHGLDRAYTVPQVLRFASDNGLKLQSWLDGVNYSISACIADPTNVTRKLTEELELAYQWHAVELIAQSLANHRFLLCHAGRPEADYALDFEAEGWLDYVPSLRHKLRVSRRSEAASPGQAEAPRPVLSRGIINKAMRKLPKSWRSHHAELSMAAIRDPFVIRREWHTAEITAFEAALIEKIDGERSIGAVTALLSTSEGEDPELVSAARDFFRRMADWDHIQFHIG